MRDHFKYFVSSSGKDLELVDFSAVENLLDGCLTDFKGNIFLNAHNGLRPWWQRFIFGAEIYLRPYFWIVWSGEFARLIFYDDNSSEYRVLNKSGAHHYDVDDLKDLSMGDKQEVDAKFVIEKSIAVTALREFMSNNVRPSWMEYEFVR